jgi:hypothetical protein
MLSSMAVNCCWCKRVMKRPAIAPFFLLAVLMPACGASSYAGQLFINEVLPSNQNNCADEAGERNDWMELYNGGTKEISLEGFTITDDTASPEKFRFSDDQVVAPGEFLLLWADGTPDQGATHLSFKFKAKGEEIVFYDAEQRLIDQFKWVDAVHDVSFARIPDGTGDFVLSAAPTCGAANDGG